LQLANWLKDRPDVPAVCYPGLTDNPFHATATRQFNGRFGGILTFDLKDKKACFSLMNRLTLIRRATNINDNKTLILHPASTTHRQMSDEVRSKPPGRRATFTSRLVCLAAQEHLDLPAGILDQVSTVSDLYRQWGNRPEWQEGERTAASS